MAPYIVKSFSFFTRIASLKSSERVHEKEPAIISTRITKYVRNDFKTNNLKTKKMAKANDANPILNRLTTLLSIKGSPFFIVLNIFLSSYKTYIIVISDRTSIISMFLTRYLVVRDWKMSTDLLASIGEVNKKIIEAINSTSSSNFMKPGNDFVLINFIEISFYDWLLGVITSILDCINIINIRIIFIHPKNPI